MMTQGHAKSTWRKMASLLVLTYGASQPFAFAQNVPNVAPPVVPAPVVPAPVIPAPVTPAPATPTPLAPAPATSAPAAAQPTTEPAAAKPPAPKKTPAPAPVTVTALSTDPQPTYTAATVQQTQIALERYRGIANAGGWPQMPLGGKLSKGAKGPAVETLIQRLIIEGDLPAELAGTSKFDESVAQGVKKFQSRVGLVPSGLVATATLNALNIPAEQRVIALEKSLERLSDSRFQFGERYVIVNIPALAAEAIDQGQVSRRHVVIVGKPDRASPMVETRLTVVNFNPTWTVPTSLIKKDLIPKMRKNPATLASMKIRILDRSGNEVPANSIDWNTEKAVNYTLRQDPGPHNSLGRVRIDMPNREAVFMHDTPSRRLFLGDARFLSSGCVRVGDVDDFVTWLLTPQGWEKEQVKAMTQQPERKDVRLTKGVPVAWVYLTGWASADGTVNFRNDVYGYDVAGVPQPRVVRAADKQPIAEPPAPEMTAPPPEANTWFKRLLPPGQVSQPTQQN